MTASEPTPPEAAGPPGAHPPVPASESSRPETGQAESAENGSRRPSLTPHIGHPTPPGPLEHDETYGRAASPSAYEPPAPPSQGVHPGMPSQGVRADTPGASGPWEGGPPAPSSPSGHRPRGAYPPPPPPAPVSPSGHVPRGAQRRAPDPVDQAPYRQAPSLQAPPVGQTSPAGEPPSAVQPSPVAQPRPADAHSDDPYHSFPPSHPQLTDELPTHGGTTPLLAGMAAQAAERRVEEGRLEGHRAVPPTISEGSEAEPIDATRPWQARLNDDVDMPPDASRTFPSSMPAREPASEADFAVRPTAPPINPPLVMPAASSPLAVGMTPPGATPPTASTSAPAPPEPGHYLPPTAASYAPPSPPMPPGAPGVSSAGPDVRAAEMRTPPPGAMNNPQWADPSNERLLRMAEGAQAGTQPTPPPGATPYGVPHQGNTPPGATPPGATPPGATPPGAMPSSAQPPRPQVPGASAPGVLGAAAAAAASPSDVVPPHAQRSAPPAPMPPPGRPTSAPPPQMRHATPMPPAGPAPVRPPSDPRLMAPPAHPGNPALAAVPPPAQAPPAAGQAAPASPSATPPPAASPLVSAPLAPAPREKSRGRRAVMVPVLAACTVGLLGVSVAAATGPTGLKMWGAPSKNAPGTASTGQACAPGSPGCVASAPATDGQPPASAAPVTIAIGGDSNSVGGSGDIVSAGLGGVGQNLAAADIGLVNLETTIGSTSLPPESKTYTFMAPPSYLDALGKAGVDVVTGANNHGMDYGPAGLKQTLGHRRPDRPTIIGLGNNAEEAFKPWVTKVRGRTVTIFGANDVLDTHLDWLARPDRPGMAMIKTPESQNRLVEAVRKARQDDPQGVVVVYLHAGVELKVCPSSRQQDLARIFSDAGANVVAMSHAHLLQPSVMLGNTAVLYGMGNFIFESHRPQTQATGVARISVPASGPATITWQPARISGGRPRALQGSEAAAAIRAWESLPTCGAPGTPVKSGSAEAAAPAEGEATGEDGAGAPTPVRTRPPANEPGPPRDRKDPPTRRPRPSTPTP